MFICMPVNAFMLAAIYKSKNCHDKTKDVSMEDHSLACVPATPLSACVFTQSFSPPAPELPAGFSD